MDPISQGTLGAIAAIAAARPKEIRLAAVAGCLGGMIADLDTLIRSEADPLLTIEYHRHFSHSLLFIPIGGLIACLLLYPFLRKRVTLAKLYLYATLGYATSGLLDACTSYGTQLLWPFSELRISWSIISIVDPLFTLPLLALLAAAALKKSRLIGTYAVVYSLAYFAFGTLQNQRAASFQHEVIASRGHETATHLTVKPSIANLVLWRSIYLHDGHYYVDALRLGLFAENKVYPGASLQAFDTEQALSKVPSDSPLNSDLTRFEHFSEGYLAALPNEESFITDLRYSAIPHSIDPLWGLNLANINESGHAAFETRRNISEQDRQAFLEMLKGH